MLQIKSVLSYRATIKYAFTLYMSFNILCAFYFMYTGFLGGDFANANITSNNLYMLLSLIMVTVTFVFFLWFLYPIGELIKTKNISYVSSQVLDWFLLAVTLFGLYGALKYGVGIIGFEQDISNASAPYRQGSAIIQPVMFGLIYFFYRASFKNPFVIVNLFFYIILIIVCGQTGQILLLFFLWVYLMKIRPRGISNWAVISFICLGLFCYPFIRLLKEITVHNALQGSEVFSAYLNVLVGEDFLEIYVRYFFITLERFQIVANLQYLIDQRESIYQQYQLVNGDIGLLFSNYWLIVFIAKIFGWVGGDFVSPQNFLAMKINGSDTWASHIGILGFFIYYGIAGVLVLLFCSVVVILVGIVSKALVVDKRISLLGWLMTLQLICHGWFFPYFYFLQTLIFFGLVLIVIKLILSSLIDKNYL